MYISLVVSCSCEAVSYRLMGFEKSALMLKFGPKRGKNKRQDKHIK
jgi:hypothetical protein